MLVRSCKCKEFVVLGQRHYQTLLSRKSQQYSVSSTCLSSLVIDTDPHLKVGKELRNDVTTAELVTKCQKCHYSEHLKVFCKFNMDISPLILGHIMASNK